MGQLDPWRFVVPQFGQNDRADAPRISPEMTALARMGTIENKDYSEAAGLQRCSVCGLWEKDLVGTPLRCPLAARCTAVKTGKSLGGLPIWPTNKVNFYELDAAERGSVRDAVFAWQTARADDQAEGAILLDAIMDDAHRMKAAAGKKFRCGDCNMEFDSAGEAIQHKH